MAIMENWGVVINCDPPFVGASLAQPFLGPPTALASLGLPALVGLRASQEGGRAAAAAPPTPGMPAGGPCWLKKPIKCTLMILMIVQQDHWGVDEIYYD